MDVSFKVLVLKFLSMRAEIVYFRPAFQFSLGSRITELLEGVKELIFCDEINGHR